MEINQLFLDGHKLIHHLDVVEDFMKGKTIVPIHAEISPTSLCNQNCRFCYRDFDGHKSQSLSREVFLGLIRSLAEVGVKSVLLAGDGEPLMNEYTPDAIVLGREMGLDMALNSNAVLLTEGIIKKILPSLTWIRFSVMSPEIETYKQIHGVKKDHLRVAIDNIKKCVEFKREHGLDVTIGIQQVLLRENATQVFQEAQMAKTIGVDYYVLKPFSKHNENTYSTDEDLHIQYHEELQKAERLTDGSFNCIIRWNTFEDKGVRDYEKCYGIPFIAQIGADGGFYSCCPFFGMKEFSFGNLYEKSFEEILRSERRKVVIKNIIDNVNVHKDCMTYCRHHQINKFLWTLENSPAHLNFI
ncbi:MAG: radical SAM protein [Candidatus Scalindua sp.]|jgi:GTP 3',8-cyclase|nr:radical SAM protein [Candidatus Scalindua sp.]